MHEDEEPYLHLPLATLDPCALLQFLDLASLVDSSFLHLVTHKSLCQGHRQLTPDIYPLPVRSKASLDGGAGDPPGKEQ